MLFADGIVKHMKTKSGPSSKNLDSLEVAEKFFSFPDVGIVGKMAASFSNFLNCMNGI